ncbi:MAG: hypothetical protein V4850_02655 [Myxococcota bacterium]
MTRRLLSMFAGLSALAVLVSVPLARAGDDDDWKDRYDDDHRDFDRDYDRYDRDYDYDYDRDYDYDYDYDYDRDYRDYRYFDDDDDDGVDDRDDICPQTNLPDDLNDELGRDRFAILNDDGVFETRGDRSRDYSYRYDAFFTIDDTGGCSCDQIIDALDLGDDAQDRGCREEDIDRWIDRIHGY